MDLIKPDLKSVLWFGAGYLFLGKLLKFIPGRG